MEKEHKKIFIKIVSALATLMILVVAASYGIFVGFWKKMFDNAVADELETTKKISIELSDDEIVTNIIPNQTTPEKTLRTFWQAIVNQDEATALACVDAEQIATGVHGMNVYDYITEQSATDISGFTYQSRSDGSSVRSNSHSMDYDMDLRNGKWVIVSIHP